MGFMKKQSAGFFINVIVLILTVVSLVLYLGNCKTAYFTNLGVDHVVLGCLIAAIVVEVVYILGNEIVGRKMVLDICPVATGVLLTIATIVFLSTRVNGIAAIMTFTQNASTMADLNNTIMTLAFCAVSMILSWIASFTKVVKEQPAQV